MERYRNRQEIPRDCKTLHFLTRIQDVAQPPLDVAKAPVHEMDKHETYKFFPHRAVTEIFKVKDGVIPVEQILRCPCSKCKNFDVLCKPPKRTELKRVVENISSSQNLLLAILIYIGHGYLIRCFGSNDHPSDKSLDAVRSQLQREETRSNWERLLHPRSVDEFCQKYDSAKDLFQPPTFRIGGPTPAISNTCRMPFLDDLPHARGAFGEVRKFNIHEDYVDQTIRDSNWFKDTSNKYKFARKILKYEKAREIEWEIERENLQIFTEERHPNIIQAICFYKWQDCTNIVFPFVEGTLERLLSGEWKGPEGIYLETFDPLHHWLWTQMIGVAEGLKTIHNPQSTNSNSNNKRTIGFHFDLKPANILVTNKGELKISDFGLSLIKRINPGSTSYGYSQGGSPRYLPPETSLSEYGDLNDRVKTKYDVWSYACIVLEVLIYLFYDDGSQALKTFGHNLDNEGPGSAFFGDHELKNCVEKTLIDLNDHTISEARGTCTWTNHTVAFLREMFNFDPETRPSSIDVATTLQRHRKEFADSPGDELELELKKYSQEAFIKSKFTEIKWNEHFSFIKMEGIFFTWPEESRDDRYPCRINIWCHKEDRHFVIARSFRKETPQSREQSLANAYYVPLSAYNNDSHLNSHACSIIDKDREVRYYFPSKEDLNSFQEVLLCYQLLFESIQAIQTVDLQGHDRSNRNIDGKTAASQIQIWEGLPSTTSQYQATSASNHAGSHHNSPENRLISSLGNLAVACQYKIMIFLNEEYIDIPLSHGNPKFSYGRAGTKKETVVNYTKSTTIKVLPDIREGHRSFNVARKDPKAKVKPADNFPAIPLCSNAFNPATLRTDYVELHFGTTTETQAFANFIKNHNVLKMYWTKCKNEVADEKRSRRSC